MSLATDMAQLLLRQTLQPGDWVVDATVGNGHDTVWLAHIVGPTGRVFGFDVQAAALAATAQRIAGLPQVTLVHSGHQHMAAMLPAAAAGKLAAVMFNLGFLPGADKSIVTHAETTLAALQQATDRLAVGGQITVVQYPGHPGGADEAAAVHAWARQLPDTVAATSFARLNAAGPAPELLAITRIR